MRVLTVFLLLLSLTIIPSVAEHKNEIDLQDATEVYMPNLVDTCHHCQTKCNRLIDYCLDKGGDWAKVERINALRDCNDISQLCAGLASRQNPDDGKLLKKGSELCAEACAEVETNMAKLSSDQNVKHALKGVSECKVMCTDWWKPGRRYPRITN